ncbi:MAG: tRNA (N(6)-L-threonylcarbamoyladenosine(37)-C(2))-methylthiotransferase MtaB [Rickettsiales bacterium]|nr:tRNA (N(6)-L-threonylcarbamoyladenosine(37)-C(2))-methylthiotransferase MtaB [Rickettsiales bacterium]
MIPEIEVITFGCRLNGHESGVLRGILEEAVARGAFGASDGVVVFNSCAVTAEAERQLKQSIRKTRRERGEKVIIGVVGCAVQVNDTPYRAMPEVDFVLGNADKLNVESYIDRGKRPVSSVNIPRTGPMRIQSLEKFEGMTRASVKIQDGCDNGCTFCVTHLARGRSISVPPAEILDQVRRLVDLDYREIVLTGVNICDYGKGLALDTSLGGLVRAIAKETSLDRLRLSSLDIAAMDPELVEQIKYEKRLMPHLHLSLQSGNDVILKRMGRRHSREDTLTLCEAIINARPEIVLGADFIAGFPTETDEMHRDSLSLIEKIPITYGHIFPYNRRPGTVAASMSQIQKTVKKARAKQLRETATANLLKLRDSISGTEQKVFVETKSIGRLENYLQVHLREDHSGDIGKIVMTTVLC